MKTFIDKLEKIEYLLMVVGIVITVVILFAQVILRYVFNASLPWIEEAGRYLFIYFTWIGTSLAASSGDHIRVEILQNKFPGAKKYLEILCHIVCGGMAVFMLVFGIKLISVMRLNVAVSPTMKIPMWICYFVIPIAGALMIIKYVYLIILTAQGKTVEKKASEEVKL